MYNYVQHNGSYVQFKGNNPFGSQAKMLHHLDRVQEYMTTGDTSPIFVEMNLTDKCNLRCEWCISENCRSQDTLESDIVGDFLTHFKQLGGRAVTFSGGGEPTLHPTFNEFTEYAKWLGLDIGLMTNGLILPKFPEKFSWIRISLDTVNPDKYKRWKGVDIVNRVLANFSELSKHTKVGINCNVHPELTPDDVFRLIDAVYDEAAYVQFRPILPRYFKQEEIKLNDDVWWYLRGLNDPKINISNDKLEDLYGNTFGFSCCTGHVFNPVVQANGDVAVCMYHPRDSRFVFGNLYDSDFKTIWESEQRKEVIRNLATLDYETECQACCKLTELNKFVDFLKTPYPDVNFL